MSAVPTAKENVCLEVGLSSNRTHCRLVYLRHLHISCSQESDRAGCAVCRVGGSARSAPRSIPRLPPSPATPPHAGSQPRTAHQAVCDEQENAFQQGARPFCGDARGKDVLPQVPES